MCIVKHVFDCRHVQIIHFKGTLLLLVYNIDVRIEAKFERMRVDDDLLNRWKFDKSMKYRNEFIINVIKAPYLFIFISFCFIFMLDI